MYYRLLAPCFLPDRLTRILYLDPDILVINSLRPLWETDLEGRLFAAAAHTGKTNLANNINQVRLGTDNKYYNSGVLLMNLEQGRKEIRPDEIFAYSREHARELLNDNKKSGGKYGILRLMLLKKIICKDKKLTIPEKM